MSFVVDPSPRVRLAISRCSPAQQEFFKQVCEILAENPYAFRDVIQKNIDGAGRVFYQYYDGVIPLVFTYRVYPPESDWAPGKPGYVPITDAQQPWW